MTQLFFRNDIGRVARFMDELALETLLEREPSDSYRAAAALLLKLDDRSGGPSIRANWRYQPPSIESPLAFTLVLTPSKGVTREIGMALDSRDGRWIIEMDEEGAGFTPPGCHHANPDEAD